MPAICIAKLAPKMEETWNIGSKPRPAFLSESPRNRPIPGYIGTWRGTLGGSQSGSRKCFRCVPENPPKAVDHESIVLRRSPATVTISQAPSLDPMKSVLIVEDDPTIRLALLRFFGRQGWQVDAVNSVERAVAFLKEMPLGAVLLDWQIGDLSGLHVLTAVKMNPAWHTVPVLVMCANPSPADIQQAYKHGANDVLPKPFPMEVALNKLNHCISKRSVGDLPFARENPLAMTCRDQLVKSRRFRAVSEPSKLMAESENFGRTLLDGVSHELRTPLAVITSGIDHLAPAVGGVHDVVLSEMRLAARRLNRLVSNLLDQTRSESGLLKPRLECCDARDIASAAVEGVQDSLAGHPFEMTVSDDVLLVRADFALTEQALANLLLNAAIHTAAGTPILLTAGVERDGQRVFFKVADRGPGLSSALRERLFQRFVRGHAGCPGGLGLGLSIVRGFIIAQGGEVACGDNPGGGAVFTIHLLHQPPSAVDSE